MGYLPVTPTLALSLVPKVPIENLFRMLEYAYNLKSFELLDGAMQSDSLADLYERLASILAKRVLDRARRGLYASYQAEAGPLPYVRGSIDMADRLRRPWDTRLPCRYEEHTADLEENQILAWTLGRIAQAGFCSERTLPIVRRAFHTLHSVAGADAVRPSGVRGPPLQPAQRRLRAPPRPVPLLPGAQRPNAPDRRPPHDPVPGEDGPTVRALRCGVASAASARSSTP